MADEVQTIRSINWRALFPFLHLFRAFRVAIHPSKLALGFLLVLSVYSGGRILDGVWPARQSTFAGEIDVYTDYRWKHDPTQPFDAIRENRIEQNAAAYAQLLKSLNIVKDSAEAIEAAHDGEYQSRIRGSFVQGYNDALKTAADTRSATLKKITEQPNGTEQQRQELRRAARDTYQQTVHDEQVSLDQKIEGLISISPRPIFDTFLSYEIRQFYQLIDVPLSLLTAAGLAGAFQSLCNLSVVGPAWLLRYHPVYFILFAAWLLVVWAVCGGAISRIAAIHVARDERVGVRQALRFSTSKLLSFVFAPLIPLIFVLVLMLVLALGGLLLYLPVLGPIAVGAAFILALLVGLVATLAITGTVGGFGLMYPTIAVEGSDSFDAISRSMSYVFHRPWRLIFYTLVSLVYGALCFLFVRTFVYVMLGFVHYFTGWFLTGKPEQFWPQIWPPVNFNDMSYHINFQALAWSESLAALFIAIWVYVVLSVLAAYVISFYFSANTIIYYLMRGEVDATELNEVYLEEGEEDFGELSPAGATAAPAETPAPAPAPTTPPAV